MEKSGFFNAMKVGDTWDRVYKAENYAEYFASFIGNGVFPNPSTNLQVIGTDKMQVIVKPGKGWINGYKYENTDDLILPIDVADGVLHRIDKIVLRYDVIEREIRAKIKKGEFASDPKAPQLTRDADMYELGLADIKVNAGSISITQVDITDLRLNKEVCGIVHCVVDQVDTTTIFNQYLEWYKNITGKTEQDLRNIKKNLEEDFNTWFLRIKETLSGDIAGNLLNLININNENIKTKVSSEELNEFKDDTASQLADITTQQGDLQNLKTKDKTNLVSAVNELFQSANNGKSSIANVVGNPLLATDTFQQQSTKIQSLKNTFANNLTAKEQPSSGTESLKSLVDKIANIKTGLFPFPIDVIDSSCFDLKEDETLIVCPVNRHILSVKNKNGYNTRNYYYDVNLEKFVILENEVNLLKSKDAQVYYSMYTNKFYCFHHFSNWTNKFFVDIYDSNWSLLNEVKIQFPDGFQQFSDIYDDGQYLYYFERYGGRSPMNCYKFYIDSFSYIGEISNIPNGLKVYQDRYLISNCLPGSLSDNRSTVYFYDLRMNLLKEIKLEKYESENISHHYDGLITKNYIFNPMYDNILFKYDKIKI
ncbi:hypothetical protein ACFLKC_13970 [Clostridium caseinilyticum]|uniref:hypothetical protein n=1 Tax=Clostridium caseinilyticum TaxID=3350403 RepID=UPI0038F638C4